MSSLGEELRKILRGEVDDSPETLAHYSRDASLFAVRPQVVVYPKDAEDICAAVRFVDEKKKVPKTHLSITPRAAGTDMGGGPLGDSIVLDVTKHLHRLLELDAIPGAAGVAGHAVAEPGMFFRDFDKETKKKGLELPSYTASRELNAVGGMVANDSGGEKNLKYGKTARYVEKLDVVCADGAVHHFKKLEGEELQQKLAEDSWEGSVYRRVRALISTPLHRKVIAEHKPKVEKNSSGYALWEVGDPSEGRAGGTPSLNLARLMVGAQGTLGIITKIWFTLVRPKPYAAMTVIFLRSLSELGEVVPEVLKHEPDSFESYDDHTFTLATKYFFEFAQQMSAQGQFALGGIVGLVKLGLSFLPEVWMVLSGGVPKLVLLVEFRAETQKEATGKAQALAQEVRQNRTHLKVRVAKTKRAARKYWVVRRESFNLLRKKVVGRRTAPFIDDFVVPPSSLVEFLPKLEKILSRYKLTYTVAGHVGDGNFHIIPLVDPRDPGVRKVLDELSHKVYDLVLSYHGSITGEHNDGLVRTPYVEKMFGKEMFALFHEVKSIFDPQNIFNPGKKVGTTFSDAFAHLDLPVTTADKAKKESAPGR
ncbi:FAD-binding oxidoreductase [Patescibacteria group bacterium]|nr:FAD-binding oxidoreductase [Patescibacteria group bacterium]